VVKKGGRNGQKNGMTVAVEVGREVKKVGRNGQKNGMAVAVEVGREVLETATIEVGGEGREEGPLPQNIRSPSIITEWILFIYC
jgi:hypothetical protein